MLQQGAVLKFAKNKMGVAAQCMIQNPLDEAPIISDLKKFCTSIMESN